MTDELLAITDELEDDAETQWDEYLPFKILDDDSRELTPVVGHTMVECNKALIIWGGYYHAEEDDIRHRSSSFLHILPAGLLADSKRIKWILYHVPRGDVPPSTSGSSAVLCDSQLFIFGGYMKHSVPNNVMEGHSSMMYVLDLIEESWSLFKTREKNLIPTPRDKMVGWCHGKKCYYFGGYGPRPFDMPNPTLYLSNSGDFVPDESSTFYWNNQLLIFDPDPSQKLNWSLAVVGGTVPSPRAACASTYLAKYNSILIFGGRIRNDRLNDSYMLDLSTLIWSQIQVPGTSIPQGRTWCSLNANSPDQAVLYGGYSSAERTLSDFWKIQVTKNKVGKYEGEWTSLNLGNETQARLWHTGAIINGKLFVCGGTDDIMEQHIKTRGVWRRRVKPSSLMDICLSYLNATIVEISMIPYTLQIRMAWTRYLTSEGADAFHLDTSSFQGLKLADLLNMCQ
ncbi:unnamed protein product [Thelazia callipaeda]|uniref:Kelch domain-containing protein n=1 Tax=Thelazia callipaeda TaxID=103827 RepID=A0A158RBD5_THECL|nr:unnamed protein product [Thelazia callipaeda]